MRLLTTTLTAIALAGSGGVDPADPIPGDPNEEILALLAVACDDPLEAPYDVVAEGGRGTLLACAYERRIDVEEMAAIYEVGGHTTPTLTTAVHKLRVAYVTEREPGEEVVTSGAVYIADQRRGAPFPIVVLGHGSVGTADHCAPSIEAPDGFEKDWKNLVYTFAGDGWVVIQPDFPGLGTAGTTTWMHGPDEGHAVLDATRAARRLFAPEVVSDENALIGHSNGGHAVLAAQAYMDDYGAEGTVETVIALNPFWLSNAAWGALISAPGVALIDSTFLANTMMYFMGHLAAYEGEEARLDAFLPDKQQAAGELMDGGCWREVTGDDTGASTFGADIGADLYTTPYVEEVGGCGIFGDCASPLAQQWLARWVTDRPGMTTSTPIVHFTGENDDFLTPDFQQCGVERMEAQGAPLEVCVSPGSNHSGIIPDAADWLRRHLAHVLLGEEAPEPCAGQEVFDELPTCSLPIDNGLDPTEP